MKVSKIFAGMSALAIAAALAAPVAVSAEEAAVENNFYPATGKWVITYKGSDMRADTIEMVDPPTDDDGAWAKGYKAQLVAYTDEEGNKSNYSFGMNFQLGHLKKGVVTINVTSDTNNIFDGNQGVGSGCMYTTTTSWDGSFASDYEKGWKKYDLDADGNQVMVDGATDINGLRTGGKYCGNWAQITLTDTNIEALTFEVIVEADEKTEWEYHAYNADKADEYNYEIFRFGGESLFNPISVDGSDGSISTNKDGSVLVSTPGDYINAQIPGAVMSPDAPGGDTSSNDDGNTGNGDTSSNDTSSGDTSSGDTSSGDASSSGDSSSSGSSSAAASGSGSSTRSGSSGTTGVGAAGSTTSSASAGEGEAASDATENAESGAAAGVGLAIAALAGAAVVVSRKR